MHARKKLLGQLVLVPLVRFLLLFVHGVFWRMLDHENERRFVLPDARRHFLHRAACGWTCRQDIIVAAQVFLAEHAVFRHDHQLGYRHQRRLCKAERLRFFDVIHKNASRRLKFLLPYFRPVCVQYQAKTKKSGPENPDRFQKAET